MIFTSIDVFPILSVQVSVHICTNAYFWYGHRSRNIRPPVAGDQVLWAARSMAVLALDCCPDVLLFVHTLKIKTTFIDCFPGANEKAIPCAQGWLTYNGTPSGEYSWAEALFQNLRSSEDDLFWSGKRDSNSRLQFRAKPHWCGCLGADTPCQYLRRLSFYLRDTNGYWSFVA